MLTLDLTNQPRWHDLAPGVRVLLRPLTTALMVATRRKRALGVQQALEWAFRTERARLELPEPPGPERGDSPEYCLEYVLMQCAALGCRIDGGRYRPDSSTHEDAEVIAACVAGLPASLGRPAHGDPHRGTGPGRHVARLDARRCPALPPR